MKINMLPVPREYSAIIFNPETNEPQIIALGSHDNAMSAIIQAQAQTPQGWRLIDIDYDHE